MSDPVQSGRINMLRDDHKMTPTPDIQDAVERVTRAIIGAKRQRWIATKITINTEDARTLLTHLSALEDRERVLVEALKAGEFAPLPEGFVWGSDALEQFNVGRKQAVAAIRRVLPTPNPSETRHDD